MAGMGSGIRAEESAVKTAGNQFAQRLLVNIAFQDRQTIKVGTHAANQHMVAVEHQVLRGDGGRQQLVTVAYVFSGIFGRDVFEDHLQAGQALTQRLHDRFNKACFPVKNIDIRMGDLTVNQQRHPQLFHAFQHRHNGIRTGNAVAGVGGGVGRIELGGSEYAFVKSALQLRRVERIRQIAGHQRRKIMARRDRINDTLAIGEGGFDGSDRWYQVRHHDRPAIKFTGIRHDGF